MKLLIEITRPNKNYVNCVFCRFVTDTLAELPFQPILHHAFPIWC